MAYCSYVYATTTSKVMDLDSDDSDNWDGSVFDWMCVFQFVNNVSGKQSEESVVFLQN